MPIKKVKPTSPGRRFATYADFAEITKTTPEKSLTEGLRKSGGRNATGRHVRVDRIDSGEGQLYPHLVRGRRRQAHLLDPQGRAVTM